MLEFDADWIRLVNIINMYQVGIDLLLLYSMRVKYHVLVNGHYVVTFVGQSVVRVQKLFNNA